MDRMSQTQLHTKRKEILLVMTCFLIGFALRFYSFDQKSLWMDEIYTVQDSRDDFSGHLEFYKEKPTNMHPPLFYILTHLFYPFNKAERDIRIFPLCLERFRYPWSISFQECSPLLLPSRVPLPLLLWPIILPSPKRVVLIPLSCFLAWGASTFYWIFWGRPKRLSLFLLRSFSQFCSIPVTVLSPLLYSLRCFGSINPTVRRRNPTFLLSFFWSLS